MCVIIPNHTLENSSPSFPPSLLCASNAIQLQPENLSLTLESWHNLVRSTFLVFSLSLQIYGFMLTIP